MDKQKSIKAKISVGILIAVLSLIVAVISLGLSFYNNTYNVNAEAAKTLQFDYSKSSPQYGVGTIEPACGTLYYGWSQKKGSSSCKYTLSYKLANKSSYTKLSTKTFSKNNVYYGEYRVCRPTGHQKYNFKCQKLNCKSTTSRIRLDLMIL